MKTLCKIFFLLFFLFISCQYELYGYITRGSSPGEIYISSSMYFDGYYTHVGVFHSLNNGETIYLKYETIDNAPPGEMRIGKVLGDATPGALYNYGSGELWVSFDFGEGWEFRENTHGSNYLSGCIEGEIYKQYDGIYLSSDYGESFTMLIDYINMLLEIGFLPGELYGLTLNFYNSSPEAVFYSSNYECNFIEQCVLDTSIAGYVVAGHYPQLKIGATGGEVYLVTWWADDPTGGIYKIFHSIDTGYSFTLKYTSEPVNFYYWGTKFTAGRTPGSFYVKRTTSDPTTNHTLIYIDYSNDYGQTFTTYFHDLGDLVGTDPSDEVTEPTIKTSCYPNPFYDHISFDFSLPEPIMKSNLQIFNIHGNLIKEYKLAGKEQVGWDGTGISGQKVESGIYLYRITSGRYQSELNKIVYLNTAD